MAKKVSKQITLATAVIDLIAEQLGGKEFNKLMAQQYNLPKDGNETKDSAQPLYMEFDDIKKLSEEDRYDRFTNLITELAAIGEVVGEESVDSQKHLLKAALDMLRTYRNEQLT